MPQFLMPQQEHLAPVLIQFTLQVQRVVVTAQGHRFVIVAQPVALEVECRLQFMDDLVGIDAVVKERHVHLHLALLMIDRVGVLKQHVAIVALITLGPHQFQLADGRSGHRGVGDFHAVILLADRCDKVGRLELKRDNRGVILFLTDRILTMIVLEQLLKGRDHRFFLLSEAHTIWTFSLMLVV